MQTKLPCLLAFTYPAIVCFSFFSLLFRVFFSVLYFVTCLLTTLPFMSSCCMRTEQPQLNIYTRSSTSFSCLKIKYRVPGGWIACLLEPHPHCQPLKGQLVLGRVTRDVLETTECSYSLTLATCPAVDSKD